MAVYGRHGLHQVDAVGSGWGDSLEVECAFFLAVGPTAEEGTHVLDAREDVFACPLADVVDHRHDLVAADSNPSHPKKFAILQNLLFGFFYDQYQFLHFALNSMLLVEFEHEFDALMEGGWYFFEFDEMIEFVSVQLHLGGSEVSIGSSAQLALLHEHRLDFLELIAVSKGVQNTEAKPPRSQLSSLLGIQHLLSIDATQDCQQILHHKMHFRPEEFGSVIVGRQFSRKVGVPQLQDRWHESFRRPQLPLQYFGQQCWLEALGVDAGDVDIELAGKVQIEGSHEWKEVLAGEEVGSWVHICRALPQECYEFLAIQVYPDDFVDQAPGGTPEDALDGVEHLNNYISPYLIIIYFPQAGLFISYRQLLQRRYSSLLLRSSMRCRMCC